MLFDGSLNIATGLSMTSVVWKNKKVTWSALADKLATPIITAESFKEYTNASKDDKGKIKDLGGFVGGYLRGGRRKPENVLHRCLLTLDLDYAYLDFWENFILFFGNAAILHSTHSHSPQEPRYRLIMPLSREVQCDEYMAISRKVASLLNIELFDNTTFQVNRLMFWPSISKDASYYFKLQDGPFLDPDTILDSYTDWRDTSGWPTSQRTLKDFVAFSNKQQDPEEKRGLIGAFCRTYSIQEAIEIFLPDIYIKINDNTYTYSKGSTAGGLKIYDGKFAYSHHGTDPCSGLLCNAFDLVRLHKYGYLDDDANSKKSQSLMEDFVREDREVKILIANESIAESKYDFSQPFIEETNQENAADNVEWAADLEVDSKGSYLSTANNLNLILKKDPKLKKAFRYNHFDAKRYVCKDLPWRQLEEKDKYEVIKNADYSGLRNYLEGFYGITGPLKIDDALALEFERQSFHPIKKYLSGLTWDGISRINSLLVDYFGVVDNVYHQEAIRKTVVAAIARIMVPGIKFDLVLTLVGSQGSGKSTFVRKLGNGWSSDSFSTVQGKEAFEQLQGAWLIEMAELSGLRKADIEAIKHFISKQEDSFRPAYMRVPETFKRQCVFIGTTNNHNFLNDPTGNRRFMPIDVVEKNAKKNVFKIEQQEVDQIWAEAKYLWENGEKLYLSVEAETIAKNEQADHVESDSRTGLVVNYLETPLPAKWDSLDLLERLAYLNDPLSQKGSLLKNEVCAAEVWCECLNKNREDMDKWKMRDINEILKNLKGWEAVKQPKKFKLYGIQKYYERSLL